MQGRGRVGRGREGAPGHAAVQVQPSAAVQTLVHTSTAAQLPWPVHVRPAHASTVGAALGAADGALVGAALLVRAKPYYENVSDFIKFNNY